MAELLDYGHGNFDRHHVFWPRRAFRTQVERTFRTTPSLVIPAWIPSHRLLHAELPTPPRPDRDEMLAILAHLEEKRTDYRLDGLFYTVEFVTKLAEQKNDAHLGRLANHLTKQLGYLSVVDSTIGGRLR